MTAPSSINSRSTSLINFFLLRDGVDAGEDVGDEEDFAGGDTTVADGATAEILLIVVIVTAGFDVLSTGATTLGDDFGASTFRTISIFFAGVGGVLAGD